MIVSAFIIDSIMAAITAVITSVAEEAGETAAIAVISKSAAYEFASTVEYELRKAIEGTIISQVSDEIISSSSRRVEEALKQNLNDAMKDILGSRGLEDVVKAMTAIPLEEVVNKLAREAIDEIESYIWVFKDPTFLKLIRLIKALRAIQMGKKPTDKYDDDDNDDEENCRIFKGPEMDLIFFTVFGSEECQEGDEVYSMFAQWNKLRVLVDDPIWGHYVSQLFQELFESCAEDVEEEEGANLSLIAGTTKRVGNKQVVEVLNGRMVEFGNKKIHNIYGSTKDKRRRNWLKEYYSDKFRKCDKCYIASADPECRHTSPLKGNIVGGHVWSPQLRDADDSLYYYILPICKSHNKRNVYDKPNPDGSGWLMTSSDAFALRILSSNKVPGWEAKRNHLIGFKTNLIMMTAAREGEAGECQKIIDKEQLALWVLGEVHNISLKFAKRPIASVVSEVSANVSRKLQEIVKAAGSDAEKWAKSEVHNIKTISSYNPFYEIYETYQAIKLLYSLKGKAIARFYNKVRSELARYIDECFGDLQRKHRKQRLVEETDKVIASMEWKDSIAALKEKLNRKVPN